MSPAEVRDFLGSHRFLALAGRDVSGRLTSRVRPYVLSDDVIVIDLGSESPFDLATDPRICAVVDVYPSYADIKGVIVRGEADMATSGDAARSVVRLPLDRVTSFDFRKEPPVIVSHTSTRTNDTTKE